jgi:hypothetical protein
MIYYITGILITYIILRMIISNQYEYFKMVISLERKEPVTDKQIGIGLIIMSLIFPITWIYILISK